VYKLFVLTDNFAGGKFLAEHGLSYLIEYDNKYLLFDTGHSSVFIQNAQSLGIDLQSKVDTIVLSHGHWDHGDGLKYLQNKKLIAHPDVFKQRFRKNDNSYIGLSINKQQIEAKFRLIAIKEPREINSNIIFLGEIPRLNDFEAQTTPFIDQNNQPDFVPDDSALAIISNNRLNIVTGCSHAGICNIIEHAKKVTGFNRIHTVIGGFHLKHNNTQTKRTIEYFKNQNIENIYPSHCTDLPALSALNTELGAKQVKTGMKINF
jgi:7,8-dihydropterin-6-yl-methyl-4-(beta-D-ribofuranosyl)aminobenzene 5'-phosphate synthase